MSKMADLTDKERVRAVVREAVRESLVRFAQFSLRDDAFDLIVGRSSSNAADQLATPAVKLTEEERNHLLDIRTLLRERHAAHASAGLWSAEIATLDRLLKETP